MKSRSSQVTLNHLDLGRIYFKACDFDGAVTHLERGLQAAEEQSDWSYWGSLLPPLLRILAERLDHDGIRLWQAKLKSLRLSGLFPESSAIEYVLGIAASYRADWENASTHFNNAATLGQSVQEIAQARFGLAAVESQTQKLSSALRRLEELEEMLSTSVLIDLRVATGLLRAICLRELGDINAAFGALHDVQALCQVDKNLFMSINILFCFGSLHQTMRDWERAIHYFELCEQLIREKDLRHIALQIVKRKEEISNGLKQRPRYELRESERTTLLVPGRDAIDCTGSDLLIKLLKLLAGAERGAVSKEQIVQALWNEEYHPLRHDNKVFVTIRRLRGLLKSRNGEIDPVQKLEAGYRIHPSVDLIMKKEGACGC